MESESQAHEAWGSIAAYDPSMAAAVAEMFNDFNSLWPGGFGGGIPYDEQRVHDWLDHTSALADLIALDDQGEPVGYCGLYPHWRDAHAVYVSVLGVVPRVKGKGFGKRLLLQALQVAMEKGVSRFDLHTWPGNLNAVPLYKKIGLFWVPETSVYMQNYIPGLFQIPLAREWFDRHPDWYGTFKRDLAQAPDKHTVDGMELYVYRFEEGDDRLLAEVDRYGWGFCGIERVLDGREIAIKTRLKSHDILMGIPNEMTISIANHTDQDLPIALAIEAFQALRWSEPFPLSFTVRANETVVLTRAFVVDRTARTFKHEASETIRSRIILGNQVLDLVTGAKIQPAVDLSHQDAYQVEPAGSEARIYFDLTNHTEERLNGHVDVFVEGGSDGHCTIDFGLDPQEVSGTQVSVSVPADPPSPVLMVHAIPSIERDGSLFPMPAYRFPVIVDTPDLAVVVPNKENDHLHLLTDVVDVSVDLEGARIYVSRRSLPGMRRPIQFEAGPPFGISLDQTLDYAYETICDGRYLTLVLFATSQQFPDLQIRKVIRVSPGVREVEHWVALVNLQATGSHTVGGRLSTAGGGFTLNPFGSISRTLVPVGDRVIECDGALPFVSENMVSQEPDHWSETWAANQSLTYNDWAALFWKPDHIKKIKVRQGLLSSLESESKTLRPGESFEVFHVWYGFSFTSPADVRNRWNQLVGHKRLTRQEQYWGVPTRGVVEARLVGENILAPGARVRRVIELRFATPYPLPGNLSLAMPPHWEGAFVTPTGPAVQIPMPQPVPGTPIPIEVELQPPSGVQAAAQQVQLHFTGEFEMDFAFPFLLATDQEVIVQPEELEGKPVLVVSNGALTFNVLAELGGNLIRLVDVQDRTFLYDNFPDVLPKLFFEQHIGGVQPVLFTTDVEQLFVEPEQVQTEVALDGRWKGVRATWKVRNQPKLRGQEYSLCYLTLPGSNLVRMRLEHHNPTGRQVRWVGLLFLNLAFQGSTEGLGMETPGGMHSWIRNSTPQAFFSQASVNAPWARVFKGDQSLTLFSPEGWGGAVHLFDLQALAGGFMVSELETVPGGRASLELALAVNEPKENTQTLIRALAKSDTAKL